MEKTLDTGKTVNLPIPGALIQRIRALQPIIGETLGFRTKATQYHVISEAIGLLEKREIQRAAKVNSTTGETSVNVNPGISLVEKSFKKLEKA